ncbi:NAD(P)H-dependent D-xylose reductase [Thozetella sp. PMI_491]|nr:NAD(P)H-dependent D-xylose reductase [Thozetella sp. PMI_491]
MATTVPSLKLASGHDMPLVGFGIWKVPLDNTANAVYEAIKLGYRHIDGAWDYTNSVEAGQGVRRAIEEGLIKREDIFITSKLWNNYHKREHAIEAAIRENEAWGVGYLDLFLIHFPIAQKYIPPSELKFPCFWSDPEQKIVSPLENIPQSETWAALETLVRTDANPQGILKSIGVANFGTQLLRELLGHAKIPVSALQIELHPYLVQPELVAMAQENGIAVTAYSSFGPQSFLELNNPRATGAEALFTHPVITKIAEKHGKTAAQVLLRWATQRDIIVIPKSNSLERLRQNLESTSFDLAPEEISAISALDKGLRFNDPSTLATPIRIFG